jgi:long-chain acyl-CoA synthetase
VESYYWAGLTDALFRNGLLRALSRLGQVFPIDPRRGPMASLAFAAAVVKRGDAMVWFPEGQRSPEGKLLPFRPGIGLILKEYPHVPVVPVYIDGAFEALPVGSALPRPRKITVHIGKPLMPEDLEKAGEGDSPHQCIVNALHDAVAQLRDEVTGSRS